MIFCIECVKKYKKLIYGLMVGILLALFVIQGVDSMLGDSATVDECPHITAGYTLLKTGEARMNPEHPFLVKVLAAAPLLFQNINLDLNNKNWKEGDEWKFCVDFLYHMGNDADKILLTGRLMVLGLGFLLGILVWRFACELFSKKAGLLALFLYVESSLVLAHSRLVTTDIGVSLFFLLTLYCLLRFFKHQKFSWLLLSGLSFGLANITKFSAITLVPIAAFAFLVFWRRAKKQKINLTFRPLFSFLWFCFMGLFVVWVAYGFPFAPEPAAWQFFDWKQFKGSQFKAIYEQLVPTTYFRGFIDVIIPTSLGRDAFLLGGMARSFWYYFPVAFILKTQIALLIGIVILIVGYLFKKIRFSWREGILWGALAIYLGISMAQRLNIGVRHILPMYPVLFILVSPLVKYMNLKKIYGWVAVILIFWYGYATISSHPAYLQYFNEFVGGAPNGYKYLIDSNLDWGQDLKRFKKYLDEHNIDFVALSYFGKADLTYEGIKFKTLHPEDKNYRGWVAISASMLQWEWEGQTFEWLRKETPVAKIGNSIFLYYRK